MSPRRAPSPGVFSFQDTIDLGGGPLVAQGCNDDVFLARYDVGGAILSGTVHGDGAPQKALALGAGPGGLVIAGRFVGSLAFGATMTSAGGYDGFVARHGASPAQLRFGDAGYQAANAIAVDGSGRIVAAGDFSGTIDLGLGPFGGPSDAFVASFD